MPIYHHGDLYIACISGDVNVVNAEIARGSHNWDSGLRGACCGGHLTLVELMIAHGATDYNYGLRGACEGGHVELINMMIAHGATDWDAANYCSQNIIGYVKSQQKLHDARSVPIIRMLRRRVKFLRSVKRIQRWWRCIFPLWRELAYAPPNGIRYRQSLEHFTQILNILKTKI